MLVWNIIIKYGIFDSNIYNFNKIGFFMRMLNYTKVVITSNRKNKPCTKQFGNHKWISIIQVICADGYALFPYVIMKKKWHFFSWYQNNDLFNTWHVQLNENNWTINEINLN